MNPKTFTFKAPNAEEFRLLSEGIMKALFIPFNKIDIDDLYDDNVEAFRFDQVTITSPSGKEKITCDHILTDIVKPGYTSTWPNGNKPYMIKAVQHMYRIHIKLRTEHQDTSL